MNNMNAMMKQLQQVQKKVMAAQQELENSDFPGEAGGGKVKLVITGKGELKSIKLDRSVVDPEDVELLEDLILTAFHQAKETLAMKSEAVMGGVKMPGMPGLPGFR
ncbi:MAG: YbaB/EbfC family nucleoid-associated protein [Fibrobacterota bacterium]|nr:YbaB/EbfC family nucleoid-associated protein [Fibrobacterota bacterium]QQS04963.1 MAG: YbaB/EbfC family nucleoid-associated protein [Fibrobacterota bacterium]